jgi:transcriptional regulator with XRE-family HTH domain
METLAREVVRSARQSAKLTQAGLATRAGTSQPTVAAYETGRREPTVPTLDRLVRAAGFTLEWILQPTQPRPLTREERRSLFVHRAIARKLLADPPGVLAHARRNLMTIRAANREGSANRWLDQWDKLLAVGSIAAIVGVLTSHDEQARELRQNTPFAGVLSESDRASVYAMFRASEHAARTV